ncbi:prostatic acid phosphatase-like [Gastrophryne carolinensis]
MPYAQTSLLYFLHFFIFLSICFLLLGESAAEKKLKLAIVLFRHGDRSPFATYPNDKYKEESWPDGFGQLTQLGMEQQYELGKYLRKRYYGFINETYSRQEVFVRSTDMDRTIMSVLVNLAGLFPPVERQIWNQNFTWQPIPVHTVPLQEDNMLYMSETNCPSYVELQKETYASKELHDLKEPYMDFVKTLQNVTGYSAEQLNDGYILWTLYDSLLCESLHNYTLPDWVTTDVMDKLLHLSEISMDSLYGIYKQHEKSRLMGGVLVKQVLENITEATASPSKLRLIMYSAHDTTLAALHMALNVSNGKLPPYASCHFFELYQDENGTHSIEMYYRNDSSVDPYPVTLPGCSLSCPLDRFTDLTSSIIAQDWKKECNIVNNEDNNSGTLTGLIIAVIILSIVVLGLLTVFYCKNKKQPRSNYDTVLRHGDRNPTQAYPNDIYKEDSWPEGYGQLTKETRHSKFSITSL